MLAERSISRCSPTDAEALIKHARHFGGVGGSDPASRYSRWRAAPSTGYDSPARGVPPSPLGPPFASIRWLGCSPDRRWCQRAGGRWRPVRNAPSTSLTRRARRCCAEAPGRAFSMSGGGGTAIAAPQAMAARRRVPPSTSAGDPSWRSGGTGRSTKFRSMTPRSLHICVVGEADVANAVVHGARAYAPLSC